MLHASRLYLTPSFHSVKLKVCQKGSVTFRCAKRDQHLTALPFTSIAISAANRNGVTFAGSVKIRCNLKLTLMHLFL